MFRRALRALGAAAIVTAAAGAPGAAATPSVGAPAPSFAGTDSDGGKISLDQFAGKTVVLEWTNHQCPYVRKHYSTDNMQKLQKEATADGVVWLQVLSSGPGREGHLTDAAAEEMNARRGAKPSRVILDAEGTIGRKYAARHTPTMAVIDGEGTLVYYGAIDDDPDWHPDSVRGAKNHVRATLADLAAGRPVAVAKTRAYGCTINYAD